MATIFDEMEKLAEQQEKLQHRLCRLLTNMKKDSPTRKTEEYVTKHQQELDQIWKEAQRNHQSIRRLDVPNHKYHTENFFVEYIQNYYDRAVKYLSECPKVSSNDPEVQELKRLEHRIEKLIKQINDIEKNLQNITTKQQLEFQLEDLRSKWKAFDEPYSQYEEKQALANKTNYLESRYEGIQNMVTSITEKVCRKISNINGNHQHIPTSAKTSIVHPLPNIKLPIFEGNYENWSNFYNIFHEVIAKNTSLSNIEKMQYLKLNLRGEASRLIQHLSISEDNYDAAWEILTRRYANSRILLSKLINKILDLPTLQHESAAKLKTMHDTITECLQAISNLGIDTSMWGPMVSQIIIRKWDSTTNKLYEQSLINPHEIQSFEEILKFLERRFYSLEAEVDRTRKQVTNSPSKHENLFTNSCMYCNGQHSIYSCYKFKQLPTQDKLKVVKDKNLCKNCLKHKDSEKCYSKYKCMKCDAYHHTWLHVDNQKITTKTTNKPVNKPSQQVQATMSTDKNENTTFLATALIETKTASGEKCLLRALIDQGSQKSFITEEAAQTLALPRNKISAEVVGINDGNPKIAKSSVVTTLTPRFRSEFKLEANLIVLPRLTSPLPSNEVHNFDFKVWENKILADPTFDRPGPIDILLGVDLFTQILLEGVQKTSAGIVGQRTELGWILSGHIPKQNKGNIQIKSLVICSEEDKQLTKFWEIEDFENEKVFSEDDKMCEQNYVNTTSRNEDGTYTVRIPFKEENPLLGVSKPRAVARFQQLERKFQKNEELKMQYNEFMLEYEKLGHMKIVPKKQQNRGKYYIPHHAVLRENSCTTKLRVVFDASSQSSTNKCLNETMFVGPRLQDDLADILLRWRLHKIVFTADIEKMYRQIKLHEEDQEYHRIVWRYNDDEPLQEYQLTTVTYGTAAAPFLAVRTLQQVAKDEKENYPLASTVMLRDFYVDDILSGANSVKEAIQLQTELIKCHQTAGFTLRKWSSNVPELLENVPDHLKEQNLFEIPQEEPKKSLGVLWSPVSDTFHFKINFSSGSPTKRYILSEIAKIFDPLGWLSPVVIKAKMLIQELWLKQLQWDEILDKTTSKKWSTLQEELKMAEIIVIPRWIGFDVNGQMDLYGFCDASEKAYGAVIYAKCINNQETPIILLTAKSKVAPARSKTTLPRLELCAALLLAKLFKKVKKALHHKNVNCYAWSDSMITIGWIKGDVLKWKTYVANRVSEINRMIPAENWFHVNSNENPADAISRGMEVKKLISYNLWWSGPKWLQFKENWPKLAGIPVINQEIQCHHITIKNNENEILTKFSSYSRMLRVLSYCNRFINHVRKKPRTTGFLKLSEINATRMQVIKLIQHEEFQSEINALSRKENIGKKSKILNLNPFLDEDGILRVGGRLENSILTYAQKHPIIIPSNKNFTKLLINDAHHKTLHGGNQITLAYIRRNFWILHGKRVTKSTLSKCTVCLRYRADTSQQLMGQLPKPRVTPSSPFSHTGIDYAGPIPIRATKGRGHKSYKGYIAIFVCLSTKAIHLEVVSDMTTDSFLAAYKRFISRRGPCSHIYSDNGTTFVGAAKFIEQEVIRITQQEEVQSNTVQHGTTWHFIPPASPHFGGLWEAGVKSMKYHLKRVIGDTTLTYEELTTVLHQIEASLNSRPLCPLSEDIDDTSALTPGHFLIGKPILSPMEEENQEINGSLLSRWKLVQKIKKDFWKAWSTEYLSRLQQRYKWNTAVSNLQIGTLVLIKDKNISPSHWPLAKIIQLHPAADGTNRVVTLKKGDGITLKRSIHNLIPILPKENNEVDNSSDANQNTTSRAANMTSVSTKPLPTTPSKFQSFLTIALLFTTFLPLTKANFTINYPKSGFYIEQLGHTLIDRGIFRIETKFDKLQLDKDNTTINNIILDFSWHCKFVASKSNGTHCDPLVQHLEEKMSRFNWLLDDIGLLIKKRSKRGILGNLLTAIFGVNDEAYQDIEELDKNQKELVATSNHQTKIMLGTLKSLNETEVRINSKINTFNKELDQVLRITHISEIQTDINNLHFRLISTYLRAVDIIDDIYEHYSNVVNIHFRKGSFYHLLPPNQLLQIISSANKKLPSHLQILAQPIVRTTTEQDEQFIRIFAYFSIVDQREFSLLRITPTPLKINESSYFILDIPNDFLAVDYNSQLYYQLTHDELRECIPMSYNKWVCSPTVIKNVETNPNCVIYNIYHQSDISHCQVKKYSSNNTIWKQLQAPNTWMFITNKVTRIALSCNGVREDIELNKTGIIQISQDCMIITKQNILPAKRMDSVSTIITYSKEVFVPSNMSTIRFNNTSQVSDQEPVLRASESLGNLINEEKDVQLQLDETTWKTIRHHSIATSTIVALIIFIIIAIGWKLLSTIIARWLHCQKKQVKDSVSEAIEMPISPTAFIGRELIPMALAQDV